MSGTTRFILGGIVGVIGILGLVGAADAEEGTLYYAGLLVFAAAVVYDLGLVKSWFDQRERTGAR